ncbi:MAG: hypothetical protein LR011_08565 [Verrucomicrobia bacterium]|nr:hypothetical protein [Verrucomicrobiota bacterium]
MDGIRPSIQSGSPVLSFDQYFQLYAESSVLSGSISRSNDEDGDHLNNYCEYLLGTNPFRANTYSQHVSVQFDPISRSLIYNVLINRFIENPRFLFIALTSSSLPGPWSTGDLPAAEVRELPGLSRHLQFTYQIPIQNHSEQFYKFIPNPDR